MFKYSASLPLSSTVHAQRYASPPVIIEVTRFPSSLSTPASRWSPQPYLSVALLAITGSTFPLSLLTESLRMRK